MELEKVLGLLRSGKKTEAKDALVDYLKNLPISEDDEAEALLGLSSLLQKMEVDLAGPYKELIEEVAEEFRDINLKEKILTPKK